MMKNQNINFDLNWKMIVKDLYIHEMEYFNTFFISASDFDKLEFKEVYKIKGYTAGYVHFQTKKDGPYSSIPIMVVKFYPCKSNTILIGKYYRNYYGIDIGKNVNITKFVIPNKLIPRLSRVSVRVSIIDNKFYPDGKKIRSILHNRYVAPGAIFLFAPYSFLTIEQYKGETALITPYTDINVIN